jgi:hypothetical protein
MTIPILSRQSTPLFGVDPPCGIEDVTRNNDAFTDKRHAIIAGSGADVVDNLDVLVSHKTVAPSARIIESMLQTGPGYPYFRSQSLGMWSMGIPCVFLEFHSHRSGMAFYLRQVSQEI